MSNIHTKPERPNTVSGLNAKWDELIAYRKALHKEVREVTCDIDHLEAAYGRRASRRLIHASCPACSCGE